MKKYSPRLKHMLTPSVTKSQNKAAVTKTDLRLSSAIMCTLCLLALNVHKVCFDHTHNFALLTIKKGSRGFLCQFVYLEVGPNYYGSFRANSLQLVVLIIKLLIIICLFLHFVFMFSFKHFIPTSNELYTFFQSFSNNKNVMIIRLEKREEVKQMNIVSRS